MVDTYTAGKKWSSVYIRGKRVRSLYKAGVLFYQEAAACTPIIRAMLPFSTVYSNEPFVLNLIIYPANATNQAVHWSLVNYTAGVVVGRYIENNKWIAAGEGTVTFRATITNGLCSSDWVQDFTLTVEGHLV